MTHKTVTKAQQLINAKSNLEHLIELAVVEGIITSGEAKCYRKNLAELEGSIKIG